MSLVKVIQGMLDDNAVTAASISARQITSEKIAPNVTIANLTVSNLLSTVQTVNFANTVFTVTSALSVINTNIAAPAVYIGTANPNQALTRVGVNIQQPSVELTVRGTISASGNIISRSLSENIFTTMLIFQ